MAISLDLPDIDLDLLTEEQLQQAIKLARDIELIDSRNAINSFFPDDGPYRRELYHKHLKFFALGKGSRERCFLAGNRVGKTISGGCEAAYHLTGQYPHWWKGRVFNKPVDVWAAGDTRQTTRDIQQLTLLGRPGEHGTGLIPGDAIIKTTPKPGVPDAIESVYVKHVSGGTSVLTFKSYDQGRKSFQGTAKHYIWLDEECPIEVYDECLIRTMTCDGILALTFTPLEGLTPVVLSFLPGGQLVESTGKKAVVMAGWDDVPHLTEKDKKELLESCMPHQRKARSLGVPSIGSGAIYPIEEESFVVAPFKLPEYWPKAYALDVGWNNTAALWGAYDRETDTLYCYSEYKRGNVEPAIHSAAIKARGAWIPGVVDPASGGSSQLDGRNLLKIYRDDGLKLTKADNSVEAGLLEVYKRLSTGRLKVFSTLQKFLEEYRLYRRNNNGKIVKENDHLADCLRYLVMSGIDKAKVMPTSSSSIRVVRARAGDTAIGY